MSMYFEVECPIEKPINNNEIENKTVKDQVAVPTWAGTSKMFHITDGADSENEERGQEKG